MILRSAHHFEHSAASRLIRGAMVTTSISLLCIAAPFQAAAQTAPAPAFDKKNPTIQDFMLEPMKAQNKTLQEQQRQLHYQQLQLKRQQHQIDALLEALKKSSSLPDLTIKESNIAETGDTRSKSKPSPQPRGPAFPESRGDLESKGASDSSNYQFPGSNVSFRIGGYVKADLTHTFNNGDAGNEVFFFPSLIPINGVNGNPKNVEDRGDNTRGHANQSRVHVMLERSDTPWGGFKAYVEGDFLGGAGNQVVTNSSHFRLRHAYGQLGHLLVGQTWSTYMDVKALPGLLDPQNLNAKSLLRQWQVRWTQPLSDNFSMAFALENPEGRLTDYTPSERQSPIRNSDTYPDGIIRALYSDDWGHLQLSTVLRELTFENDDGLDETEFAYGVQLSGRVNTPITGSKDSASFELQYGDGIGRYISDIAVGGPGGALFYNNKVATQKAWSGFLTYQHWWLGNLRSTAAYGHVSVDTQSFQFGGTLDNTDYAALNLIWSPVPYVNLGVEGLYGRHEVQTGQSADASRVITSAQFFF